MRSPVLSPRLSSLFTSSPSSQHQNQEIKKQISSINPKMTSYYALFKELRLETRTAYTNACNSPRDLKKRLNFYLHYMADVIPHGLTARHVPSTNTITSSSTSSSTTTTPSRITGEEIQLLTPSGYLFMTGLVALEDEATPFTEEVVANEAYNSWLEGFFGGNNWRFFTAMNRIGFREGYPNPVWNRVDFDPIVDVEMVARHLMELYEGAGYR